MHIDYARVKFYLKSSQKKMSQIIFEHLYKLYGNSPHSAEAGVLFNLSNIINFL